MGWAVGRDLDHRRHIGYGVPAECDHPDCDRQIDRGLSYACGGGVVGEVENCGLFFCGDHLPHFKDDDADGGDWVCERCGAGEPAFDPKPDVAEWVLHVLTDDSWRTFLEENPVWADDYRARAEQLGLEVR